MLSQLIYMFSENMVAGENVELAKLSLERY
jgi:hypothetical protein